MNDDTSDAPADPAAAPVETPRAIAMRERFRRSQLIAAQSARARAAGGAPNESESARLVAEFHARGGQVTVCPPAEEPAPGQGPAGTRPAQDAKPSASDPAND